MLKMLRCSPSAFFHDDMRTPTGSGQLIAVDIGNGYVGYSSTCNGDDCETLGSLSLAVQNAYRVFEFGVNTSDNVKVSMCVMPTAAIPMAVFQSFYMTITVASVDYRVKITQPEDDAEGMVKPYEGLAKPEGLAAALDTHKTATVRFDAPDLTNIC